MFGLGWMEIGLLFLLLVLVFGAGTAGSIAGRLFGTAQKVNSIKSGLFNPADLLSRLTGFSGPKKKD